MNEIPGKGYSIIPWLPHTSLLSWQYHWTLWTKGAFQYEDAVLQVWESALES